jgi:hypothetical protein
MLENAKDFGDFWSAIHDLRMVEHNQHGVFPSTAMEPRALRQTDYCLPPASLHRNGGQAAAVSELTFLIGNN